MRRILAAIAVLAGGCGAAEAPLDPGPDLDPGLVVSGVTFLTPETQALQRDAFANPGLLWVDRGAALFSAADGPAPSCANCHDPGGLAGVAARYPKIDAASGRLVNLEGRINLCRERRQGAPALSYESEALLSLTAYLAALSKDAPMAPQTDADTRSHLEAGRAYFFTRRGQFNLACSHCHDDNWGRKLRGDTISQGHGNGFPAYRLEWQTLGSLHRRFQDCDAGVRAEPKALGSDAYLNLELYLAARASGLALEAPAVRR